MDGDIHGLRAFAVAAEESHFARTAVRLRADGREVVAQGRHGERFTPVADAAR